MSGTGAKLSIPSNTRKMIQNIKEIASSHSEEEIYAMLKECSMDPNETAQKLLLQDAFHEVKRKRDKKKENANSKESGESRWKPGTQVRGSRGGWANFSTRHTLNDGSGNKNSGPGKESSTNQTAGKDAGSSLPASHEISKEAALSVSSGAIVANGSSNVAAASACEINATSLPEGSGVQQHEVTSSSIGVGMLGGAVPLVDADKTLPTQCGTGDTHVELVPGSSNSSVSVTPASSSAVCFSSSDPVLVLSNDLWVPGAVGTIKREVGNHQTAGELDPASAAEKADQDMGATVVQGKMASKSQGVGKSQLTGSSQPSSALGHGSSSGSRPSSNYSNRSQLIAGPQKGGLNKEWKPKPTSTNMPQGTGTAGSSDVPTATAGAGAESRSTSSVLDSEESTSKLQKKLEELHLPLRQHVIIPNHIHVPESERSKLSFGSFDATFGVTPSYVNGPESDKSSTPPSENSQGVEENFEDQAARNHNPLSTAEEEAYPNYPQSKSPLPGNLAAEGDVSSNSMLEYNESKQETALLAGGYQHSLVHTSLSYSYGFVPPMLGSQVAPFENSESPSRDVSCLPSFVVQQPFDPTSYYAQFYRPVSESEGRVSPFPLPGVAAKCNGNVAILPSHTSQTPQEAGNSFVLSAAGPTPIANQTTGLMQSSMAVTQQPVPVFRPPAGMHIPHYVPNYIPYGHFFSPFYIPHPGIHQFLGNGVFPQQPQAGSAYPAPPVAAGTGVKYSLPQFKPGTNTGNTTHIGVPSGYGPYGSSPAGYNPTSASAGGNSTANEDLGASQFKEDNVYTTGQQSEGLAVWMTGPGRDISSLPAGSLYNLPPQDQHVTLAPTQTSHGTFASVYHPAQAVTAPAAVHPLLQQSQAMAGAADMVGSAASVYQQPQHQQTNWPSNY